MRKTSLLTFIVILFVTGITFAQNENTVAASQDSSVVMIDGVRFETVQLIIDSTARTATVELSLTSLKERPRELKINVYGIQLVDNERNAYYFSTATLGRVLMRFEDRQNYLHYLLQPDTPAKLTITAENISKDAVGIQLVKVVFEDSEEEGRFLDAYLTGVPEP